MKNNIIYFSTKKKEIEIIFYDRYAHSYPMHTHASHMTLGYVMDGEVSIICDGREHLYRAGETFCILPDVPHAVGAVKDKCYSMISICLPVDAKINQTKRTKQAAAGIMSLKQMITEAPEKALLIEDMSRHIYVSPYHMIRQFKVVCGLTPHQFQIQCRVRKAQKLLEAGKSVTEAAYATGFCDQSHFDRCFRKIVRLSPTEYKRSVRLLLS